MTKEAYRRHNDSRWAGFSPQFFALAAALHDEFYFS
jgi:hypothetical protein